MFVNDHALTPQLTPEHFRSEAVLREEKQRLFSTGWHLVASKEQLARPGDYAAFDLFGVPVIVRNEAGALVGFHNICVHRHSLLEREGCGHRSTFRCQYHGWGYGADGRVTHMPDGPSFKGFKLQARKLTPVRVEALGPLVYVSVELEGPSLMEWLGPLGDELRPWFERRLRAVWVRQTRAQANWKVLVENAVESYHVPLVHPKTYAYYRPSEFHDHRIEPTFTRYADLEPWNTSAQGRVLSALARVMLGQHSEKRFSHAHRFPNQLYYFGDLVCDASVVMPVSATESLHTSYLFVPDALWLGPALKPLQRAWEVALARQTRKIFAEDAGLWASVQKGLQTATGGGVLSVREERVWAFQRYVAERLHDVSP
jgi:choline monooxygenase